MPQVSAWCRPPQQRLQPGASRLRDASARAPPGPGARACVGAGGVFLISQIYILVLYVVRDSPGGSTDRLFWAVLLKIKVLL